MDLIIFYAIKSLFTQYNLILLPKKKLKSVI